MNALVAASTYLEHEDDVGREYMEEQKAKDEADAQWLETLGEAMMGKFGRQLVKGGRYPGTVRRLDVATVKEVRESVR